MKHALDFKLVKPARSSGGDKYEVSIPGVPQSFSIYVPQKISRPNGSTALDMLRITIEEK